MNILEMRSISKSYYTNQVLFDVNFTVQQGEIHALLGENGAGKTTLMNILAGVVPLDLGRIWFDGDRITSPTITSMEKLGITFVHQELNLINDLRVYENIFLNREVTNRIGTLKKEFMIEESSKLFDMLGVEIDPTALVGHLTAAEKQLLEICKALYFNSKLFILDEPTTALSNDEIDHLFSILINLKTEGKSFIFISHKIPEVFQIADTYTVLRNGYVTANGRIADTNPSEITRFMVGETLSSNKVYTPRDLGSTALELNNLSGIGFNNVSFTAKKGEIIALTGLTGCGASELLQCVFGVAPIYGGSIKVNNKHIRGRKISRRMRSGIAMLPSNRQENSVIPDLTILENEYLAEHVLSNNIQHIFKDREIKKYERLKEVLNIKAEKPDDLITSLSGGNQQKVFIARWLNTNADILLFDNPTQGVDVGAKAEIYKLILSFAEAGKTIIINTLEIPEIKEVADRCIVFYEGQQIADFQHDAIDEHTIMQYSTNAINTSGRG